MTDRADIWIELTRFEVNTAAYVGMHRGLSAVERKRADYHGREPSPLGGPEDHMLGAIGEIAVAKYVNQFWPFAVGVTRTRDVGGWIDVRATPLRHGRLIIRPDDPDETPFVLAIVCDDLLPRVLLRGWVYAGEGRRTGKPTTYDAKRAPAVFVEVAALRPMAELRALAGRQNLSDADIANLEAIEREVGFFFDVNGVDHDRAV